MSFTVHPGLFFLFFFFFLMIRRPPRSTPFPTRRSSDLEAEPAKPFPQRVHDPLGIVVGLKGHHEIISEPYQGRLPPHAWSHHVLKPFVQHMVQENVREHW